MDIATQALAAGGPIVLTIMGIIVSLVPPQKRGCYYVWGAAFLLIGAPTIAATCIEMRSADKISDDTNHTVHGLQDENNKLRITLSKIEHSLGLDSGSPLGAILRRIDTLTPHTMNVAGGAVFVVPPVSGEISIHTLPRQITSIVLPRTPYEGERLDIIDSDGNASPFGQIAVNGNGYKIDGAPIYFLPFAHQSITVTFDGRGWGIN